MTSRRALLACGFIVAGCAAERPAPPPVATPAAWTPRTVVSEVDASSSREELRAWWHSFGDATLDELIDAALLANLDVASARARVEQARALGRAAFGERLPSLGVGLQATHATTSRNDALGKVSSAIGAPRNFNDFSMAFDAAWDLDVSGRLAARERAADANTAASEEELRDRQRQLIAITALTYIELRRTQSDRALLAEIAASWEESARLAAARARGGVDHAVESARARSEAHALRAQVAVEDEAIEIAIHRLSILAGDAPTVWQPRLASEAALPSAAHATVPLDAPVAILARRPDVRRSEALWRAADARHAEAQAARWPSLTLGALLGVASTSTGNLFSTDSRFTSAGASLFAPLFEGGRLRAEAQAADAGRSAEAKALEATVLHALEEVESAIAAFEQRARERTARESELEERATARRLTASRTAAGIATRLPDLEAQRALADARRALLEAQAQQSEALVRAFTAIGAGP